ncbi:hypothetical protein GCM10027562_05100 [Arthrobacter pigmenti]
MGMEAITDAITSLDPIWMYLATLVCVAVDGVLPPVPGETVVVAVAALAMAGGSSNPLLLILTATVGAVIGDNLAYSLGQRLPHGGFQWMHTLRITAALEWAGSRLRHRPASFLLAARFIPVARVAVNLAAGATAVPRGKFVCLDLVACTAWATYTVLVGTIAGSWLSGNPLLAALAAVVAALILGWLIDVIFNRASRCQRQDASTKHGPSAIRPPSEPVRHTTFSGVGR